MGYKMTRHADIRRVKRRVTDDHLAAALATEPRPYNGGWLHLDRKSRAAVLVRNGKIVTMFYAQPGQVKRKLSRVG